MRTSAITTCPGACSAASPGAVGKVDIYNVARPADVKHMPAKFSGLRVAAGDVHVFYGPCGGGFGDPLERPAEKVLDDVLDGFCTVEHARAAYGVVLDPVAETVDEAATRALARTHAISAAAPRPPRPRSGRADAATAGPAGAVARTAPARSQPAVTPAGGAGAADRRRASGTRWRRCCAACATAHGDAWSFEIVRHSAYGNTIEVVGQLRANGSTVRETAVAAGGHGPLARRAAASARRTTACRSASKRSCATGGSGIRRAALSERSRTSLEQRATIFVEAMVVVAIIGVLAFLIAWLVRSAQRPQAAGGAAGAPARNRRGGTNSRWRCCSLPRSRRSPSG